MYKTLSLLFIPAFLYAAVSVGAELTDTNLADIRYSDSTEINNYFFTAGEGGMVIGGNNLFKSNPAKELLDVDQNDITDNSSGYRVNLASLSDAFLAVAWDSDKVVSTEVAKTVAISTDGINYSNYNMDEIFKSGKYSVGLLELDKYRFVSSEMMYVSLPVLSDSKNLENISSAGWWIIGAKPKEGKQATYSLSLKPNKQTLNRLGLSSAPSALSQKDVLRNPSFGFTALNDKIAGESASGEYHYADYSDKDKFKSLIFISEKKSESLAPAISLSLDQAEQTSSYYTVFLDVAIPEELSQEKLLISLKHPDLYVDNSMSVPYGSTLSGPLTDSENDDIFAYNKSDGKMLWTLNAGLSQLNNTTNTRFRFLVKNASEFDSIRAEIFNEEQKLLEYSNSLPIPPQKINDISVHGTYEIISSTRGVAKIYVYSDLPEKANISLNIELFQHIAIPKKELNRAGCKAIDNEYLSCEIKIKSGVGSISLGVLHRLSPLDYGVGEVSVKVESEDPNALNNTSEIVVLK